MIGNVSGVGGLKQKAENLLGSAAETTRVIRDGDEGSGSEHLGIGDGQFGLVYAGGDSPIGLPLRENEGNDVYDEDDYI